ncbi:MAG: DUF424 family protein [Candidatus Pacearchaeota archaeon]
MISIKIHNSYRKVVAVCDSDLIGKKFEEGNRQLDARENFYKGDEYNKEKAVQIIKKQAIEDASFNIVGKESINASIEAGIIKKEGILKLKGIPFALTLL